MPFNGLQGWEVSSALGGAREMLFLIFPDAFQDAMIRSFAYLQVVFGQACLLLETPMSL